MYRNTHAPGRKSSASKSANTTRRTDDALANAGRDNAFPESEATPQFLREAKDSFRIVEEARWQFSGARHTAAANQKGERRGVYQFYNPFCDVRCLVEMLAPYTALRSSAFLQSEASPQVVSAAKDSGRIHDPACGSGGSLPARRLRRVRFAEKDRAIAQGVVHSIKFLESHGGTAPRDSASSESEATLRSLSAAEGNRGDISIYGQAKWAQRQRPFGLIQRAPTVRLRGQQPKQINATTRRLFIMNLALRGIEADFGKENADTFLSVQYPDLRAASDLNNHN
jgi:type I restriction enzyme M protein